MKIPWPAWVVLDDNAASAPRPACSPAPALIISPRSPLRDQIDSVDDAPPGSIGWIDDAPVFVLEDGEKPRPQQPDKHAKPRRRIEPPERRAERLARMKQQQILDLTSTVEVYIEQHFTQAQQRLLTAAYARAIGRGAGQAKRRAKIESILDWIEAVTAKLLLLQAQVEAATTAEDIDAIQFNPSQFPPPAVKVKDIMTTPD